MFGERTLVETIPCCVDTARFRPDPEARANARRKLGLGDRTVVVYAGSLGSWYREREMVSFVRRFKSLVPDALFLVLTRSPVVALKSQLSAEGFPSEDVVSVEVSPSEMPRMLPAADLGLSFIASAFSKLGSSPTKVAEYLAAGVPVLLNGDIGDQAELASDRGACVVLSSFDEAEVERAAYAGLQLLLAPYPERAALTRRVAAARFSLEEIGVPRYERLYRALAG
jgi:glycosyltransferase involved in cell wall biosynthesis